jgi:class 3 adenylate cyclase
VERALDTIAWLVARWAVDAVRYQPRQLDLVLACGAAQPGAPAPAARWLARTAGRPSVVEFSRLPHVALRTLAAQAARWFGPTGSAVVRWCGGAVAAASDRAVAVTLQRPLRARVHPGMLVPHPHNVAVLAADMRGFSNFTVALHDNQYLADLVGEYLTELTGVVERHRGIVFQYTGDGLLALFLPELAGMGEADLLGRLTDVVAPELHATFDVMYERWRSEWQARGRPDVRVGFGMGLSFGRATIGFLGPAGKKQFGVIGEPVNLAAFLCAQANAGTVLVDRDSFIRAGAATPPARSVRLRAKKLNRRVETLCLSYGRAEPAKFRWLPAES